MGIRFKKRCKQSSYPVIFARQLHIVRLVNVLARPTFIRHEAMWGIAML